MVCLLMHLFISQHLGSAITAVERENEVKKCCLLILPLPFLVSRIGKVAETVSHNEIWGCLCFTYSCVPFTAVTFPFLNF